MATTTAKQPGSDVVITTAFELIGIGVMTLLAGISDDVGSIVVIVMVGFLLGWLLLNSSELSGWLKGLL
jgi:hypothetical protein